MRNNGGGAHKTPSALFYSPPLSFAFGEQGGAEKKTVLEGQADLTHQLSGRFGARYTIQGYTSTGSDYNPRDGVRALLPLQYWTDLDLIKMSSGIMSPVG